MAAAESPPLKTLRQSPLLNSAAIADGIFRLEFGWPGPVPKAGQFFMIKPERSSVFLPRPVGAESFGGGKLRFLIAVRGRGTRELAAMRPGESAGLSGPLGNCWEDFFPPEGPGDGDGKAIALVAGGVGLAPLSSLAASFPDREFDYYLGVRSAFKNDAGEAAFLGEAALHHRQLLVAAETGGAKHRGLITGFFDPAGYSAVFACGPEAMLRAAAAKCREAAVPCRVSLERRMACGVGACLGCTVVTGKGSRRCCADGPIFKAEELAFDEQRQ
ncbi:MAG: dihydroorotate dehydrogenase electron transfer subunit [Treponema sp.]|jgi:NAD(P)H-flavin reductase|nr:dihydroorotate dehydrogenase electron transfer subunit [Treponema sp.]